MFLTKCNVIILIVLNVTSILVNAKRPNIIFILADDLGFNDVGFHGSNEIPTPNIDALAYSGVILNRYYVTALCTPSRSALMTGKHPIHTGMQHTVLYANEPRGLPLNETILPQYLKELGYTTRIVGKWHLGHYKKEYTPTYRGFDSHTGFWTGHHDYYDHTAVEENQWGLDMRRNLSVAYDLHGQYSTEIFTNEAVNIIETHNKNDPLFLYIAHAAVHSGNPYNPLPAFDQDVTRFNHISNFKRRKFAAILSALDTSVGKVVEALGNNGLLENSIIIFSSDNGGAANGFNLNAASNWPLRGVKNTLFEGGVRAAGLIWSPLLSKSQRISSQIFHISDWLPTLYHAAGGDVTNLKDIDGINSWIPLSIDIPTNRTEILHNIDDIYGNAALTVDDYKILKGSTYNGQWDFWYGPSGRDGSYNISQVMKSRSGMALASIGHSLLPTQIHSLRNEAQVICTRDIPTTIDNSKCVAMEAPCLFNIKDDPCELKNLANELPDIVAKLEKRLNEYNETAVPAANLPRDPAGDPKNWDYTWTNFGDYDYSVTVSGV